MAWYADVCLHQPHLSLKLRPSIFYLTTAVLNDYYNEVTAYTVIVYSVFMTHIDAKVTSTDDTDYSSCYTATLWSRGTYSTNHIGSILQQ